MGIINQTIRAMAAAVGLLAAVGVCQATTVSSGSNNPLSFSWSFNSAAGLLTGTGSMTLSGFNSSALEVAITLNNTSTLSSNRLTSFGFGIDPNATSVSFSDPQGSDGGMIGAALSSIPSIQTVDVCAFGGPNCSGGGGNGIFGGGSDTFSVTLAGTWGSSVNIDPIGFKYQTGSGSFEFTTGTSSTTTSNGTSTSTTSNGTTTSGPVPEPLSTGLVGLGLGMLGLSFAVRRKQRGL